MMAELRRYATPEGEHLAEQERLLAELTEELTTQETEFATQGAEFARFRAAYLQRFAPLYAELDRIDAEIARLLATEEDTASAHQAAQEAAERADQSEEAAQASVGIGGDPGADLESGERAINPHLRDLFRRAAKSLHPDTARNEEERVRRTRVMAAVNQAYERGDADAIQRILDGEEARPESVEGDDVGSRLIRTVRMIARVRARFVELAHLQKALEGDPMWKLFVESRDQWLAGGDPFAEDEAHLRARIESARARLAALGMADGGREAQPPA